MLLTHALQAQRRNAVRQVVQRLGTGIVLPQEERHLVTQLQNEASEKQRLKTLQEASVVSGGGTDTYEVDSGVNVRPRRRRACKAMLPSHGSETGAPPLSPCHSSVNSHLATHIAPYLGLTDMLRTAQVCRDWRQKLWATPEAWAHVDFEWYSHQTWSTFGLSHWQYLHGMLPYVATLHLESWWPTDGAAQLEAEPTEVFEAPKWVTTLRTLRLVGTSVVSPLLLSRTLHWYGVQCRTTLRELNLCGTGVDDAVLGSAVKHLICLTHLNVNHTAVTARGIQQLLQLSHLHTVHARTRGMDAQLLVQHSFRFFPQLDCLDTYVSASVSKQHSFWSQLASLSIVRDLRLHGTQWHIPVSNNTLWFSTSLQSVHLRAHHWEASILRWCLRMLARSQVSHLALSGFTQPHAESVWPTAMEPRGFNHLTSLELWSCEFALQDWCYLTSTHRVPRWTALQFHQCNIPEDEHSNLLERLCKHASLTRLSLVRIPNPEAFRWHRLFQTCAFAALHTLDLSENDSLLNNIDLLCTCIVPLANTLHTWKANRQYAWRNRIGELHHKVLSQLPGLHHLELCGWQETEVPMWTTCLQSLPNLRELHVDSYTNLGGLRAACRGLRIVYHTIRAIDTVALAK